MLFFHQIKYDDDNEYMSLALYRLTDNGERDEEPFIQIADTQIKKITLLEPYIYECEFTPSLFHHRVWVHLTDTWNKYFKFVDGTIQIPYTNYRHKWKHKIINARKVIFMKAYFTHELHEDIIHVYPYEYYYALTKFANQINQYNTIKSMLADISKDVVFLQFCEKFRITYHSLNQLSAYSDENLINIHNELNYIINIFNHNIRPTSNNTKSINNNLTQSWDYDLDNQTRFVSFLQDIQELIGKEHGNRILHKILDP